jgi:lysophospholipase L1-like esterase
VRWFHQIFVSAIVLVAILAVGQRDAAAFTQGVPNSMGALGDSITQAANLDFFHFGNNPDYSWATGTQATVQSVYTRILAGNPNISGKNFNYSVSGAKMTDLNGQAVNLNGTPGGIELVTIEMGGNDICTSTEATMTPVATYQTQFQTAMNTLTTGFPNRRILVLSIPDVYQLWALLHNDSNALTAWNNFSICQSLLANPQSMAQTDVDRRARVRQRNIDLNTQLSQVCALYPQCHFDNNAIFNAGFTAADVSTFDYFHPSIQGQTNLASGAWQIADMDGDGWATASEATIGTDPMDNCPDSPSDNAWPPDINNSGAVDVIGDIALVTGQFGKAVGAPPLAPARYDIGEPPNGSIGVIDDIVRMTAVFGTMCTP